jgi:hypothetical protein
VPLIREDYRLVSGVFAEVIDIASGLERRDAAQLVGMLLLSPQWSKAELVAEPIPGQWVKDEKGPT